MQRSGPQDPEDQDDEGARRESGGFRHRSAMPLYAMGVREVPMAAKECQLCLENWISLENTPVPLYCLRMSNKTRREFMVLGASGLLAGGRALAWQSADADLVVFNAKVYTMDP